MLFDNLWNLLDSGMFDTSGEVNNALIGGIASVLESQHTQGENLLTNMVSKTSDLNGIADWEKILGLPSDASLSLDERRQRCSAKAYRLLGALTKQQLVDILNVFGSSKSAIVTEVPSSYQVFGQLLALDVKDDKAVIRAVKNVLPAHLQYIPTFLALVNEYVNEGVTHSSTLAVTRPVLMNGGQLNSTGIFLDGSFKLDGSKTMNNPARPGPICTSTEQITVTRTFQSAYNPDVFGPALSGDKLLDGNWLLQGQTTEIKSITISVTCNGQLI